MDNCIVSKHIHRVQDVGSDKGRLLSTVRKDKMEELLNSGMADFAARYIYLDNVSCMHGDRSRNGNWCEDKERKISQALFVATKTGNGRG